MSDMETKYGGCVLEAYRLKMENGGRGSVYYVMTVEGSDVGHAYYIPEGADPDDKALNQSDNGYPYATPLRVCDVLKYGTKYL